jgi:hypothetical protein
MRMKWNCKSKHREDARMNRLIYLLTQSIIVCTCNFLNVYTQQSFVGQLLPRGTFRHIATQRV